MSTPDTLDARLDAILTELNTCAPAAVRGSAEAAEGKMAFMEKRKPGWMS